MKICKTGIISQNIMIELHATAINIKVIDIKAVAAHMSDDRKKAHSLSCRQ